MAGQNATRASRAKTAAHRYQSCPEAGSSGNVMTNGWMSSEAGSFESIGEWGGGSGGSVGWLIGSSSWVTFGGVTLEGDYDYITPRLEQLSDAVKCPSPQPSPHGYMGRGGKRDWHMATVI